jgi:hypothetical protein
MTAKEKCIAKWEKKYQVAIRMNHTWGKYTEKHRVEMKLCEEILKDLKRITS